MTGLLEKVIHKISKLSEAEQNKIAQMILNEIANEKKWSGKFKISQNELLILPEEAKVEYKNEKAILFD
ncbi:MAG TPA: hypothetical protein PKD83_11515 [Ignavibacteria bacterium]|nr:hypothetical protein [Ignavibacteria bacterium]